VLRKLTSLISLVFLASGFFISVTKFLSLRLSFGGVDHGLYALFSKRSPCQLYQHRRYLVEYKLGRCDLSNMLDFPHNCVLLQCSSYHKGCRPFVCDTDHLHSNCLDRFKNASGMQSLSKHTHTYIIYWDLDIIIYTKSQKFDKKRENATE